MIRISDKSLCCGCSACVTACPASCIVMRRDKEGFDYPVANPDLCLDCGRCESVCPVLNPMSEAESRDAYAVRVNEYVEGSSSGGVFPVLAESVIGDGGVVFGSVVDTDMTVGYFEAEKMDEVERMRGSKYVQSDLYSTYDDVKLYLEEGRRVMFTGTPCQVAGLYKYLGGDHDGLVTLDFACHGVPGPGLWAMYVKALEKKNGSRMKAVRFKDKSKSWRHYEFTTSFGSREYMDDPYMALFVQDVTLRPSCYNCPASGGRSHSDITVSDLWSVAKVAPVFNDDRGVSGVYVNTSKGDEIFKRCVRDYVQVDMEMARMDNGGFKGTCAVPERREEFFKGLHSATDLIAYMSSFVVRRPLPQRIYRKLRKLLSQINQIRRRLLK